jgi:DNA mismatch repair protein MutS2
MPGRSNAFAISEKLGLSPEIIESAATHLTADDIAFEELLARIDRDRQQTEKMRDEAEQALREAKEANARAQSKAREMEEKLNRDYEQARGEGKRVVSAARTRIDTVIEELEELIKQKERADFKQKVGEFKNKSRAALKELDDEIDPVREQKTEYELPRPLKIGDTVEVVGVARAAKVVTLPDKKGKLRVSTGSMSFDVKVDTVRLIKPPKEKKPYMPTMSSAKSERGVGSEIQVLGMTVAEMEPEVTQFIDRAVMTGIPSVTIVHGKGTGALRAAVWDILRLHPNVANMRLGKYGEGDSGVTIVELKR